jgi:hypothetical protein
MEPEMTKRLQDFPGLAARTAPAVFAATLACMACAPAYAQLAVDGPGLPSSVTPTNDETLWSIVGNAFNNIPTPPGFDSKNSGLRAYVMAFGGGTESVFSLGELNPSFGGTNSAPYISVTGGNYTLVDPNSGASGRDVSNLTQLVIGWVPAASGPGGLSSAVNLSGLTNSPGSYNLTALQSLTPVVQTTPTGGTTTYTGVPLFNFANTSQPNSVLDQVVAVTGTDGYTAAFSLAELDPAYGGSLNTILTYESTGNDFTTGGDGIARIVTPDDNKHGRWVSNVDSVVVEFATPGPVPGAGLLSLGVLVLAGVGARSGGIAAAARRLFAPGIQRA